MTLEATTYQGRKALRFVESLRSAHPYNELDRPERGESYGLARRGQPVAALGLVHVAGLRRLGERGADGPTGEPRGFGDIASGHRAVGRERAEHLGLGGARRRPSSRARLTGGRGALARRVARGSGAASAERSAGFGVRLLADFGVEFGFGFARGSSTASARRSFSASATSCSRRSWMA